MRLNHRVDVSNPDRVMFPDSGLTKGDVVGHYLRVAELMLPHVEGRPLTLQRFPKGIEAPGFMQKNAPDHFPDSIDRVEVEKRENGTTVYPVLRQAADIPYLANQGTVTFHVWLSRVPELDYPDRIVLDLDPPEGDIAQVQRATHLVGELMDGFGLPTRPVATGSKGYHLVAPIVPSEEATLLAGAMQGAATWIAAQAPDLLTTEFRIKKRRGRVFVDWLRSQPGQTAVAPWSLRPRPGAPVAVPLRTDQIDDIAPDHWRLSTIEERLTEGDPLLGLAATPTDPAPALEHIRGLLEEADITPEPFDRFRA